MTANARWLMRPGATAQGSSAYGGCLQCIVKLSGVGRRVNPGEGSAL